ncbi:MAG TPA: hypothetical protein VNE39_07140 [Planctomycetota bacterium]|nr:hypothetical protein [Planctomycetota bacterium]
MRGSRSYSVVLLPVLVLFVHTSAAPRARGGEGARIGLRLRAGVGEFYSFQLSMVTEEGGTWGAPGGKGDGVLVTLKTVEFIEGRMVILGVADGVPTSAKIVFDPKVSTSQDFCYGGVSRQKREVWALAGKAVTVTRRDNQVEHDLPYAVEDRDRDLLGLLLQMNNFFLPKEAVEIGSQWDVKQEDVPGYYGKYYNSKDGRSSLYCKLAKVEEVGTKRIAHIAVRLAKRIDGQDAKGKGDYEGWVLVDLANGTTSVRLDGKTEDQTMAISSDGVARSKVVLAGKDRRESRIVYAGKSETGGRIAEFPHTPPSPAKDGKEAEPEDPGNRPRRK